MVRGEEAGEFHKEVFERVEQGVRAFLLPDKEGVEIGEEDRGKIGRKREEIATR